ncbi:hypothetical protein AB0F03_19685 [Streptomyces sp. NPDC028722]|uniref:hypothetical protein n=1 Tax=Streptomyces sp. NPDC028722 TaxID=3155016 RepID=UPI0033F4ABBD
MNGDPPLTQKDIAQRLLRAVAPDARDEEPGTLAGEAEGQLDKPGAARGKRSDPLRSGRGEPSVRRMAKGEMVPTRDVLFDLLSVLEEERGTPSRQDVEELWAAYKPALRERSPFVYQVYEVVDAYAGTRLLVGLQQHGIARLERSLEQHKLRGARLDERVKRARRVQAVQRRALGTAGREMDRLRVREQRVRHELEDASAEVARMRQDVATARAQVEHWQEQAEWHLREKEELRQESVAQREAWQEREALLLERLAQACETLQAAAEQAAVVEAAMRARETHWRDQAQAGHAAARSARADADAARSQASVARAEAEAAREEAAQALRAQRDRADALVAEAGAEQEQAQHTIGRLQEELRQAHAQLRAAQQDATRQDAQLTAFVAERALNADLDDIVSQVLAQHEELGPEEPAWIDPRAEAIHSPSSEQWSSTLTRGAHPAVAAAPAQPMGDAGRPGSTEEPRENDGPVAAQGETTPDAPAPSSVLPACDTAERQTPACTSQLRTPQGRPSRWTGERKVLLGGCAGFVAVTALLALFLAFVPAPPGPVTYASGSRPTVDQSGVGMFGESTTTYTWTLRSARAVRTRFTLTDQASTLPGNLTAQPAKGCPPHVRWTLTADGKTVAEGTLADTDTHKVKAAIPDSAKALDLSAAYAQGNTCTTTLSWIIGT